MHCTPLTCTEPDPHEAICFMHSQPCSKQTIHCMISTRTGPDLCRDIRHILHNQWPSAEDLCQTQQAGVASASAALRGMLTVPVGARVSSSTPCPIQNRARLRKASCAKRMAVPSSVACHAGRSCAPQSALDTQAQCDRACEGRLQSGAVARWQPCALWTACYGHCGLQRLIRQVRSVTVEVPIHR